MKSKQQRNATEKMKGKEKQHKVNVVGILEGNLKPDFPDFLPATISYCYSETVQIEQSFSLELQRVLKINIQLKPDIFCWV